MAIFSVPSRAGARGDAFSWGHCRPGQSRQPQVAGVREAIETWGASLVDLPPDSPDLNPIEQAFAKLKTLLRKLAARTVSSLWNALGDLLDRFTPQECANYLASAGYVPFNRNPLSRGFHDCLPGTPARTVGHLRFPRFEGSASPRRASQV